MTSSLRPSPVEPVRPERILVAGGVVRGEPRGRRVDILIEGDTIRDLLAPSTPVAEDIRVIDAGGMALIPGLINAHTHGHGALSKGVGDRWTLELLLNAGSWIGGSRTDEDRYLSTLLNAVEMLKKGCTACFDLSLAVPFPTRDGLGAAARAYMDAGMRAVVAPMIGDIHFYRAVPGLFDSAPQNVRSEMERYAAPDGAALLATLAEIAADWPFPSDRVRFGMAPTIPITSSDEFLVGCHRIAREHGLVFQTHLAESRMQAAIASQRYGRSLATHVCGLGIVDPNFSGAHGVWLDRDDMALLADRGASIAHNPGSNLRLGSGIADACAMVASGVAVGIGTDGGASSDNQNMFEATRLACNLSRVQGRLPEQWLGSGHAIDLATTGSARVMGFHDLIGKIEPGYKADLVFLDLTNINFVPLNDLDNQIVHVEEGSSVKSVMVGGKVVVESGRILTVDFDDLVRRAAGAAERLREVNAEARFRAETVAPWVTRFCHDLSCGCWPQGRGMRRLENPL